MSETIYRLVAFPPETTFPTTNEPIVSFLTDYSKVERQRHNMQSAGWHVHLEFSNPDWKVME